MEYLDVLDENGNKTGEAKPKKEVHDKGLWHRTVHIWFLNSKGDLLLQLRGVKDAYPNHWDISAAGHIITGDDSISSAIKETKEEIGIQLEAKQLQLVGVVKTQAVLNNNTYFNNEYNDVYLVKSDLEISDFKFTDGEVKDVRWIPWQELKNWVESGGQDLVPHPEEYKLLFSYLENLKN